MSHGTLHSIDIQESRRFYEEVLGLEVIQQVPLGLIIRCGSDHSYVVAETGKPSNMDFLSHNGIDVSSREEVDEAHETLTRVKDEYGLSNLKPPQYQHGAYSFYFQDRDGNWWEIAAGSGRGYTYAFEEKRDMTGRFDVDPTLMEHTFEDDVAERLRATAPDQPAER